MSMQIKRFTPGPELKSFLERSSADQKEFEAGVRSIGAEIRQRGDAAIFELTQKYDGAEINAATFMVTDEEIDEAYDAVDNEYLTALLHAIDNIHDYHLRQKQNSWMESDENGNMVGAILRPMERAGIYVPGGTAAYPSSVLMNAIPAQVAGVPQIAMVSPPGRDGRMNPHTLVAAAELGLEEIYKVGGAQAIFALGWGTELVKKVDIITGPGNIWVTLAKKMVYGDCQIDMLAGPSEILIIAGANANPAFIAADMMSQAEHDVLARSILVTPSSELIEAVDAELDKQLALMSRKDIISKALSSYGAYILTEDLYDACRVANVIAPEHLELMVDNPFEWFNRLHNAGAIFMGQYTPEPVGDYLAGPNHILPTGGTARFYSPVSVNTFMKSTSLIYYTQEGIKCDADHIITLAETEGLTAHANSVRVRKNTLL